MKRRQNSEPTSDFLDRWIDFTKWPLGILFAIMLPSSLFATALLVRELLTPSPSFLMFAAGAGGYFLFARWLDRLPIMGTFFSTLEHELTHAFVALLTLHRVVSLRSSWRNGGHVRFIGRGNWLIMLAPYFLPTISLLLIPFFVLAPTPIRQVFAALLGISWGYHAWSTVRETHRGQTDLQRAGWIFSWLFLPTANLITMMGTLAIASSGLTGARVFLWNCLPFSWLGN